jgi:hypothetical protein
MTILYVIIILIIIGIVLWLINRFIIMDWKIKTIMNVLIVILVILWLLSAFGVVGPWSSLHLGNIRVGNMKLF